MIGNIWPIPETPMRNNEVSILIDVDPVVLRMIEIDQSFLESGYIHAMKDRVSSISPGAIGDIRIARIPAAQVPAAAWANRVIAAPFWTS